MGERSAIRTELLQMGKRRRLPSVTMAQNSGMALKIKETHLTTQINRIQKHPQDGADSAAAQNLLQKLQERSAIRTELLQMGLRRRLPSVTMAQNSGMGLKIQETHLTTQIDRLKKQLQGKTSGPDFNALLQKLQERSSLRIEIAGTRSRKQN